MMSKNIQRHTHAGNAITKSDNRLIGLIGYLIPTELKWLGHALLNILRLKWHNRPVQSDSETNHTASRPSGPFMTTRREQLGDLLLWVPRSIDGYLIDGMSGGYGYSHTTIDTGEIDLPSGKAVMIESTIGQKVTRKFQDEYKQRAFARVPLSKTGVNVEQFVKCVKSKMGESYDILDALTLGEIEDPAKEICSRLAADCLPDKDRGQIGRAKKLGLLCRSSVSVYPPSSATKTREFISPNGFAEFYGAPKGRKLSGPDVHMQPHPIKIDMKSVSAAAARHHGWKLLAIAGGAALVLIFIWNIKPSSWMLRKN